MRTDRRPAGGAWRLAVLLAFCVALAGEARGASVPPLEPGEVLTLQRAIAIALAYHPARLAAVARAGAAEERVGVARAGLLPQVWGGTEYLRATNNGVGGTAFLNAHGVPRAPSTGTGVNQLGLSDTFNNYIGGLSAYQFLLDFGARRGLVAQRSAEADAEQARRELVDLDIAYAVSVAYAELIAALAQVKVYERAVEKRREQLRRAELRARANLVPEVDVYTARAELARAKLDLTGARDTAATGKVGLNAALGLGRGVPEYALAEVPRGLIAKEEILEPLQVYMDRAMAARPDLRMLEEETRAAGAVIRQMESAYWPVVGAVGGVNVRGQDATPGTNYYAGVNIMWPIFSGFETDHEVAEARLMQEAVRRDIENLRLNIVQQVESAFLDCGAAVERIEQAAESFAAASIQLELIERRYAAGLANIVEVIEADRQFTGADAAQVRARVDLVMARAALARSTGQRLG